MPQALVLPMVAHVALTAFLYAHSIDRGHRFHADRGQCSTRSRTPVQGSRSDGLDRTRSVRDQNGTLSAISVESDRLSPRRVSAGGITDAEGDVLRRVSMAALSTAGASPATSAAAVGKAGSRPRWWPAGDAFRPEGQRLRRHVRADASIRLSGRSGVRGAAAGP